LLIGSPGTLVMRLCGNDTCHESVCAMSLTQRVMNVACWWMSLRLDSSINTYLQQYTWLVRMSVICVARRIHNCAVTHWHVRHDAFICVTLLSKVQHDTFTRVARFIHTCDMTHSHVRHDLSNYYSAHVLWGWGDRLDIRGGLQFFLFKFSIPSSLSRARISELWLSLRFFKF